MKRLFVLLLASLLLTGLGCGSEKDRGVHSGKDRPRSADKAE